MSDLDFTQEKFARLPKWAQAQMDYLFMRMNELEKRLTEVTEGNADSRVQSNPHDNHPFGLPESTPVSFKMGDTTRHFDNIQVRLSTEDDKYFLEVHCGVHGLSVSPRTSNSFRVYLEK